MKKVVIVSSLDPAGMNIKENLESLGYKDTIVMDRPSVNCENIDQEIDADLFIFATKHQSKAEIPSLSIHSPGNWGTANPEYGGKSKQLCINPALYIREGFLKLRELNTINYDVVIEVTHHGPYLEKPILFIEIGSTSKQWSNKEAGLIIAKTILHLLETEPKKYPVVFGIGGLHTSPILTHCVDKGYALGHICPKYMLNVLDKDMIQQAIERSIPRPESVLLDWKGLGKEKQKVLNLLKEMDLEILRSDKI
ncbi:MAG: D-aminoacyl-tRNA deacylase [Candidatus Woesearchaeota archaeon]